MNTKEHSERIHKRLELVNPGEYSERVMIVEELARISALLDTVVAQIDKIETKPKRNAERYSDPHDYVGEP